MMTRAGCFDPGKGKTMLLIGIVDELEQQLARLRQEKQSPAPTVLTYFICQGMDSNMNNAAAVLRGLIYLLAVQYPPLASNLREEYEHSGSKIFEDTNALVALFKILTGMLRDPTLARAFIIIDVLDECETGLQQLLRLVVENTSTSRVKWIVSSHNRHEIEQQLKLNDWQMKLSLELKANADYVSHAVNVYIDDRVSQLESLKDDDAPRDQVRRILRQKAADTFLWVALVVEGLKTVASWDVLDVLEEMPSGLEELYARMMKQIQQLERRNPELCRLMLATAILAYRPLHILEIGLLAGLPETISNKAHQVRMLVSMCGSFLTVRDDRVYIIHQSAKDYLMSDKANADIVPPGSTETHREIFLRSLQAMEKTLRRDIHNLNDPGFSIDDLNMPDPDPLVSVRYSCIYWVDYLDQARERIDLVDSGPVHKFLEVYLLYWVETSSLLGALPDALLAVGNLERLLKTMFSSEASLLLSLTVDTNRFLLHNGLIIKNAPLQTYVSAFLFSPSGSPMRDLFKKEEPKWLFMGHAVNKQWSPLVRTLKGHRDTVLSVAFSPDGKLIASGSSDKTIRVWDAVMGENKHTLDGHGYTALSVIFSSDGKLILSASHDKIVKVWDTVTGKVKYTLKGHSDIVLTIAFSPDGKLIASGSRDKTLKVWDASMCELKQTLQGHRRTSDSVSFDTSEEYQFTKITYPKVDAHLHNVTEVQIQSPGQKVRQCGYNLSPDKAWITWNGHRVLWLPSRYRPSERPRSVIWLFAPPPNLARVAIDCDSGRVVVISFSKPPSGVPSSSD